MAAPTLPSFGGGTGVITDTQLSQLVAGIAYLNQLGYVTDATDTTSNVGTTTTEVVSSSVQFVGTAGLRIRAAYAGVAESSVALDISTVRLRWKTTNVVDTTGTIFATNNKTAITASKGDAFSLIGQFTPASTGLVTVVATIQRILGTGTVKQNGASAGQSLYFLIEAIGN